jgi:protein SCO1
VRAVLILLIVVLAGCADADVAVDAPSSADLAAGSQLQQSLIPDPAGTGYEGALLRLPVPKPDFVLTDTDGDPFDFRTETADAAVTLLYFGFTTCPDICPSHMAAAATALREVDPAVADQVEVVFVSVDPERDAPLLRQYLDSFDPSFTGLTGTPEQVNAVMRSMGLPGTAIALDGDFPPAHPINIIAFTGDEARIAYPFGVNGAALARDLPGLVTDGVRP